MREGYFQRQQEFAAQIATIDAIEAAQSLAEAHRKRAARTNDPSDIKRAKRFQAEFEELNALYIQQYQPARAGQRLDLAA